MKLRKCPEHTPVVYTLKSLCPQCNKEAKDAHYRFIKLKDAKEDHGKKTESS